MSRTITPQPGSLQESYNRMKRARAEALRERDQARQTLLGIEVRVENIFSGVCMANYTDAARQDLAISVAREMRDAVLNPGESQSQ